MPRWEPCPGRFRFTCSPARRCTAAPVHRPAPRPVAPPGGCAYTQGAGSTGPTALVTRPGGPGGGGPGGVMLEVTGRSTDQVRRSRRAHVVRPLPATAGPAAATGCAGPSVTLPRGTGGPPRCAFRHHARARGRRPPGRAHRGRLLPARPSRTHPAGPLEASGNGSWAVFLLPEAGPSPRPTTTAAGRSRPHQTPVPAVAEVSAGQSPFAGPHLQVPVLAHRSPARPAARASGPADAPWPSRAAGGAPRAPASRPGVPNPGEPDTGTPAAGVGPCPQGRDAGAPGCRSTRTPQWRPTRCGWDAAPAPCRSGAPCRSVGRAGQDVASASHRSGPKTS